MKRSNKKLLATILIALIITPSIYVSAEVAPPSLDWKIAFTEINETTIKATVTAELTAAAVEDVSFGLKSVTYDDYNFETFNHQFTIEQGKTSEAYTFDINVYRRKPYVTYFGVSAYAVSGCKIGNSNYSPIYGFSLYSPPDTSTYVSIQIGTVDNNGSFSAGVSESSKNAVIRLTLNKALTEDLVFNVWTNETTYPDPNKYYEPLSVTSTTIAAGSTFADIPFNTNDNNYYGYGYDYEKARIDVLVDKISGPLVKFWQTWNGHGWGEGSIADDETKPTLEFRVKDMYVHEKVGIITAQVNLSHPMLYDTTYGLYIDNITTEDDDYSYSFPMEYGRHRFTIPSMQETYEFTFTINSDLILEGPESFQLSIYEEMILS